MKRTILLMALFVLSSGCSTIYVRINSDPTGAHILWGPSKEEIRETPYTAPYARANTAVGPAWRDFYYQLKKPGYRDSEIIFEAEARILSQPASASPYAKGDAQKDFPKIMALLKFHERLSGTYGKTRGTLPLEGEREGWVGRPDEHGNNNKNHSHTPHPAPLPQGQRGNNF